MKYSLTIFFSVSLLAQQAPPNEFAAAAQILRGSTNSRPKVKGPAVMGDITKSDAVVAQREFLPVSAQAALAISRQWTPAAPTIDKQGRVTFAYGEGLPVIPCALLQSTEIDLEPDEEIAPDSLDIGDNRFEVAPRKAGGLAYLVIKPKAPGLDTTMIVGTNRRSYYVRLVSTQNDFVGRVAFTYPQDEQKRQLLALQREHEHAEQQRKQAELLARTGSESTVRNTDYSTKLKGKSAGYLKPSSVWDDGVHTYIQLSPEAKRQGLPVIQIRDAKGPMTPNSRWQENRLTVDALFERACLITGVGKHQQSACITNHGLRPGAPRAN